MQKHQYFLKVNDQELDQVIHCSQLYIIQFINQHIKFGEDNQLIFHRTITWLEGASDKVLEVDKEDILVSSTTQAVTAEHEILKKIQERKETLIALRANIRRTQSLMDELTPLDC